MKRLLLNILLLVEVCSSLRAVAQADTDQAIFRMERVQWYEAACVLVGERGDYRLETLSPTKTQVFTGSLDAARVGQLQALLANEQLRQISQADIQRPLIVDSYDKLQLAIRRDQSWQQLTFTSPDSRKPFKAVDPLLHWFQDLQKKRPAATLVEESATHCLPMHGTQIADQADTSSVTKTTTTDGRVLFLFRLRSDHYYRARVESTCTIVFGDGSYHWEGSTQTYRESRQYKIADGQLQAGAVQELREILSAPTLEKSPGNPDVGRLRPSLEGTFTTLSIARENNVQNLVFSTVFNPWISPEEGMSSAHYRVADDKVIEPLKKWMKEEIDVRRRGTERTAAGNDCAPVKGVTNTGKAPD